MDNFHTYSEVAARPNGAAPDMSETLGTFARTFAYSAVQEPLNGVSQLSDKLLGTDIEHNIQVIDAPMPAKFGSITWHAEQIAGGLGMAVDFLLLNKVMPSASLKDSASAINMIGRSALTGAVYSGIFQPANSANGDFLTERLSNAAIGGVTFAALSGATIGLRAAGESAPLANTILSKAFKNSFISGLVAGVPAGIVNAESKSLIAGQGVASSSDVLKSAYSFVVAGGPIGLVHVAVKLPFASNESVASPLPSASDLHSPSNEVSVHDRSVIAGAPELSGQVSVPLEPTDGQPPLSTPINSGDAHDFSIPLQLINARVRIADKNLGKEISATEFYSTKWEGPRSVFRAVFDHTLPVEIIKSRPFFDDTPHIFFDEQGNVNRIQIGSRTTEDQRQNLFLTVGLAKLINSDPAAQQSVSVVREQTTFSAANPILRAASKEEAQQAALVGARAFLAVENGNDFTQLLQDRYGTWNYPLDRGFHTQMDLELAELSTNGPIKMPATASEALDRHLALQQIKSTVENVMAQSPEIDPAKKARHDSVSAQIDDLNKAYPGIGLFDVQQIVKTGRPINSDELETLIQMISLGHAKNIDDADLKLANMIFDLELIRERGHSSIPTIPQPTGRVVIDMRLSDAAQAEVARNSLGKPVNQDEVQTVIKLVRCGLYKNVHDGFVALQEMVQAIQQKRDQEESSAKSLETLAAAINKRAEYMAEAKTAGFTESQLAIREVGTLVSVVAQKDIKLLGAAKIAVDVKGHMTTIYDVLSIQSMQDLGWPNVSINEKNLSAAQLLEKAGLDPTPGAVNDFQTGRRSIVDQQISAVLRAAIRKQRDPEE